MFQAKKRVNGMYSFGTVPPGSGGPIIEVNGIVAGSQALLNLVAGTNVTITDNGLGSITFAASGDVAGPASSTDHALVRFDGVTGKLLEDGIAIENDAGHMAVGGVPIDTLVGVGTEDIILNVGTAVPNTDILQNHFGVFGRLLLDPSGLYTGSNSGVSGRVDVVAGNNQDMSSSQMAGLSGDAFYSGINTAGGVLGVQGNATNNSSGSVVFSVGGLFNVYNSASGSITNTAAGIAGIINNEGSGTIAVGVGVAGQINNDNIGTISTAASLLALAPANGGGGTMNFVFGLDIKDHSGFGGVKSYNLYSEGASSINIFNGAVGIGTEALLGALTVQGETSPVIQAAIFNGPGPIGDDDLTAGGTFNQPTTASTYTIFIDGLQLVFTPLPGPIFNITEAVSSSSGGTGFIAKPPNVGDMVISVTAGTFLVADVITGGTTGATATITAVNDTYQWASALFGPTAATRFLPITGAVQPLLPLPQGGGVTIQFGSTSGHTPFDNWTINIGDQTVVAVNSFGGLNVFNVFDSGKVQIVDGNQALGKILTSDASGIGTWQTPVNQLALGNPVIGGADGGVLYTAGPNLLNEDSLNFIWDQVNHRLGIGTAIPVSRLNVVYSAALVAGIETLQTNTLSIPDVGADTTTLYVGIENDVLQDVWSHDLNGEMLGYTTTMFMQPDAGHVTNAVTAFGAVMALGTAGTVNQANGYTSFLNNLSTGTITDLRHFYAKNSLAAGGTITNQYGLNIDPLTGATNNYGIYIAGASTYAIWVDAGLSRFDGDGTHVFELPADATGNVTAATGRIPILVGGITKYLRYFDS